ncbi:MAG: GxxExxY protein [bacterium]
MEYDRFTYSVIGAAIAVHKELGPGFVEAAYQRALEFELADRALPPRGRGAAPVVVPGAPARRTVSGRCRVRRPAVA